MLALARQMKIKTSYLARWSPARAPLAGQVCPYPQVGCRLAERVRQRYSG